MLSFLLAILLSTASAITCPKDIRKKTASISVGFNYSKTSMELQGTRNDAQFYHSKMGPSVSDNPRLIDDEHTRTMNREVFLSQLRSQIKDKEYVLFSYAGHGMYNSEGQWVMILPSLPESVLKECAGNLQEARTTVPPKTATPDCKKKLSPYLVTDKDLKAIFKDKKVLMFNDACLAGGMELGKSTVHVAGALSNILAIDASQRSGQEAGGAFTSKVKELYSICSQDGNHDGRIDGGELLARFPWSSSDTTSKNRKVSPKMVVASAASDFTAADFEVETRESEGIENSSRGIKIVPREETEFLKESLTAQPTPNRNLRQVQQVVSVQNFQPWISCFDLGQSSCNAPALQQKGGNSKKASGRR